MYTEVVKIDIKGRITIPSYARILLDINEGSNVIMNIDEDRRIIEIKPIIGKLTKCMINSVNKNEFIRLFNEIDGIVSVKCVYENNNHDIYRCEILISNFNDDKNIKNNITKSGYCVEF